MKKSMFWKVLGLLGIGSFVLAACGTPVVATEPATTDESPATEPASGEAPAEGDVAIRWRTRPDNQEEIDVYSQISSDLDAQLDGISLTYEPGGSEGASYQDQLRAEIAGGTAPDVFWIPGTDVADFATRGLILNAADLASSTDGFSVDDFYA